MTTTVEVHRDSFGKELTPPQHAEREAKIAGFMKGGRDRWSAENLADGRPEWSQRNDPTGPDYTKSEAYQANARHNAENLKNIRQRDPDLQVKFDSIQLQLRDWQDVLDDAEVRVIGLEKRLKATREIIAEVEGFTDGAAVTDRKVAQEKVDKIEPQLAHEKKRVDNAKVQLKTWRARLREFPQDELKKMQREDARRERLRF
jgi:hypothetical protein